MIVSSSPIYFTNLWITRVIIFLNYLGCIDALLNRPQATKDVRARNTSAPTIGSLLETW